MTLAIASPTTFSVECGFNASLNDTFRQHAGAFDKDSRSWRFPIKVYSSLLAEMQKGGFALNPIPDEVARLTMSSQWQNAAVANTMDVDKALEATGGRLQRQFLEKLLPYQRAGVVCGIQRGGKVLLGDEMGLGKTLQALGIALYYQSEWPLLVICPSSLRFTWAAEVQRWLGLDEDNVQVVMTSKVKCGKKLVTVVSYDLATRMAERLSEIGFKIIIADESHYLKSADAKRTKLLVPLLKTAQRALLLTGTPALSRPIELFTQVNALLPKVFRTKLAFGRRYCNGFQNAFGWDFTGSSNLPELHLVLSQTVLIRRLKHDVMQDLPPKTRQQVFVQCPAETKKTMEQLNKRVEALDAKIRSGGTRRQSLEMDKRALLVKMYHETGTGKIKPAVEYIKDLLLKVDKFIVFAHHIDVLRAVSECLCKAACRHIKIDGTTPQAIRQDLCKQFQTDPQCRVAVLSITAAGVGLTLTEATCVVFIELYWNPGQLLQAEDRAHRVGQKRTVDVKYLIAKGTLDDIQWKLVQRKLSIVGQSINGERSEMALQCNETKEQQQTSLEDLFKTLAAPEPETELNMAPTPLDDEDDRGSSVGGSDVAGGGLGAPDVIVLDDDDGSADGVAAQREDRRVCRDGQGGRDDLAPGSKRHGDAGIVGDDDVPQPPSKRLATDTQATADNNTSPCPMCGLAVPAAQRDQHNAKCVAELGQQFDDDDDDWD
eukprot:m.92145 g.92145  ORF g.92145 m.92145 type:complete len:714 (+) comp15062_c1_seq1:336-2477(+)